MKNFIDFLKILTLTSTIAALSVVVYSVTTLSLDERSKVYVGHKRTLIEARNNKRERCDVDEVDSISPGAVTLKYKCKNTVLYITQRAVNIEIELPKDTKMPVLESEAP